MQVIGLSLTMSGLGVWAVWSCCLRKSSCCQPYYHTLYQNYLSAETEAHLTEELKKLAKERAQIISREQLKIIREQESQQKRQGVTEEVSDNASEQKKIFVRCMEQICAFLYNCKPFFLVCCTFKIHQNKLGNISNICKLYLIFP